MVDIARFKQLPVAHEHGGWLKKDEIMPVMLDAFMEELVDDSSAAAPGPAMGFKVAPYCFVFFPKAAAKGSFKKSVAIKDCHYGLSSNIAQSSTEVMAVFKDCHQTSPKVLLK